AAPAVWIAQGGEDREAGLRQRDGGQLAEAAGAAAAREENVCHPFEPPQIRRSSDARIDISFFVPGGVSAKRGQTGLNARPSAAICGGASRAMPRDRNDDVTLDL